METQRVHGGNTANMKENTITDKMLHVADRIRTKLYQKIQLILSRAIPTGRSMGTVAINMFPANGPWGGSSVFVRQFARMMRNHGYRVVYDLKRHVDVVVLIDPREDLQNKAFSIANILAYRKSHPEVRVLHRINECDKRKNTAFIDDLLCEGNRIADYTVFISEWLCDYFAQKWFDTNKPHSIIYNGADPSIFNPVGNEIYSGSGTMRIVTHHWSSNPMKGFPIYKLLDDHIADGRINNVEFRVIGQWPEEIKWLCAKTFSPTVGHKLAELLRECHVYLTASKWEPCGMHHIEGAQCGLPLLYHEDGGGIVEAGRKYGIGFRKQTLEAAVEKMRSSYSDMRKRVYANMPSGDRMTSDYMNVVRQLMTRGNAVIK
jgi:glycosyltransferase involved in cell wall biosynthesis